MERCYELNALESRVRPGVYWATRWGCRLTAVIDGEEMTFRTEHSIGGIKLPCLLIVTPDGSYVTDRPGDAA